MTKRIVSGIFILTALGALGVILAGALTSGEQLIVRFLTAVIVAALGLYVISDLRLQADDDAVVARSGGSGRASTVDAPPNSTAAFMATVTKRGEAQTATGEADSAHVHDERSADEELVPIEMATGGPRAEDQFFKADTTLDLTVPRTELAAVSVGPEGMPTLDAFDDPYGAPAGDGEFGTDPPSSLLGLDYGSDSSTPPLLDEVEDHTSYSFAGEEPEHFSSDTTEISTQEDDPALDRFGIGVQDLLHEPVDESVTSQLPAIGDDFGLTVDEVLSEEAVESAGHEWPTPAAHLNPPTELHPEGPAEVSSELVDDSAEPATNHRTTNGFSHLPIPARGTASDLQSADYADAPLAPIIDLREVHSFQAAGSIDVAIKAGEVEVITTLIEQGMLSTDGPISDRDVRTMVYVAFTSNELRKLLLAGGSPDGPNHDLDLGPVELFDERVHMPAPKTLYTGLPKAQSQLG